MRRYRREGRRDLAAVLIALLLGAVGLLGSVGCPRRGGPAWADQNEPTADAGFGQAVWP